MSRTFNRSTLQGVRLNSLKFNHERYQHDLSSCILIIYNIFLKVNSLYVILHMLYIALLIYGVYMRFGIYSIKKAECCVKWIIKYKIYEVHI